MIDVRFPFCHWLCQKYNTEYSAPGCNLFGKNHLPYEQTIRTPVECRGVGLHSGAPVTMKIRPAAPGTGIVFRRVDLDDFEIEAIGRFIGVGLDNAIVELDNLELPILDGSAQPFIDMITTAGLKVQRRRRTYLKIIREIEVRDGNKFIGAYPADGYSVSYKISFAQPIGEQSFEIDLSRDLYRRELASARTFGFLHEAEAMKNMGLIRGASEENVIVVTKDGVKNGTLRFPDEFVRHKTLDLIGDLALLGKQIVGRIVADRAGHAMHTALVSKLLKDHSLWEETTDIGDSEDEEQAMPAALAEGVAPRS